jgi:branched-subunit amino acid aminotransferase/4-amino-4-deoxychorismate lyase
VPAHDGGNLYIRPTLIETSEGYGIKEDAFAAEALLYIVTTQNLGMGLYPSAEAVEKGIRLDACKEYIRAWPGGTGSYKLGANYGKYILSFDSALLTRRNCRCRQEEGILNEFMATWSRGQHLRGWGHECLDHQAGRGWL